MSRQGRVINGKAHGQGRRIDGRGDDRLDYLWIGNGVGDRCLLQAGDGDNITRHDLIHRHPVQAAKGQQLGHPRGFHHTAVVAQGTDSVVMGQTAGFNPARQDPTQIRIGIQQGCYHRERRILVHGRGRHMAQQQLEQRCKITAARRRIVAGPAIPANRVEIGKVQLIFVGLERSEQIKDLVQHFVRAGITTVDLVDHHDGPQTQGQRLAGNELRLWHGTLGGVDQQDDAIDHFQDAFDLAAEICMARRINDIDPGVLPFDGGALGQNGNAALAFQIIGVHGPLGNLLIGPERSQLPEQGINQGSLTVVNVGNDSNIAKRHGLVTIFKKCRI